jgi:DnaK suppressor protein
VDQKFIKQQKQTLLALKAETEQDLQRMHANQTEGIAEGEAANQEEVAVINTMRQTDRAESAHFEEQRHAIDHALQTIDEGSYGTCERCGQPIDPARLEAKPWAVFCLPCQEIVDAQQSATVER